MTAEAICDLLKPLIGKSGSIAIVGKAGQLAFLTADNKKLTAVDVRPDGLVRLEREAGWAVVDPREAIAVVWDGDTDRSAGQFL
jgi:hypothetical protein